MTSMDIDTDTFGGALVKEFEEYNAGHVDETGVLEETMKRDLVPDEAFSEDTVDGEVKFSCKQCPKSYTSLKYVKNHKFKKHEGVPMKRTTAENDDKPNKYREVGDDNPFEGNSDEMTSSTQLDSEKQKGEVNHDTTDAYVKCCAVCR